MAHGPHVSYQKSKQPYCIKYSLVAQSSKNRTHWYTDSREYRGVRAFATAQATCPHRSHGLTHGPAAGPATYRQACRTGEGNATTARVERWKSEHLPARSALGLDRAYTPL